MKGLRVERTIRKEWDMEDIVIAPSARAGKKPVILRERKLGPKTLALEV